MLIGTTVKLIANFTDFDGEPVSPENVVVRFYDAKENQLGDDEPAINKGVGEYEYDYTVEKDGKAFYEFSGTIEGLPVATRKEMVKKWV